MYEALIILKSTVTLDELIRLFKGTEIPFKHVDTEMISHQEDESIEQFISIDTTKHALNIYKEEDIMLFPDPVVYLVHFKDFDLFKKCIAYIGKSHEIIVDNDHGLIIRNYNDLSKISDYSQFIRE